MNYYPTPGEVANLIGGGIGNYLWLIFAIAVVVVAVFGSIFVYHWKSFNNGGSTVKFLSLYFVVTAILLAVMAISAMALTGI